MDDFASIHGAAAKAINHDKNLHAVLGKNLICEQPFNSSMSSVEANGKKLKQITLVFDVTGELSTGRATVSAVIGKDNTVKLQHLHVAASGGKSISVNISKSNSKLTAEGEGRVIDV
jgi:hypothetical protein